MVTLKQTQPTTNLIIAIRSLAAFFIVCCLFGCASQNGKESVQNRQFQIGEREFSAKGVLSPVFDSLRPHAQTFTIRGDRDTLIAGIGNATFSISKNTFVNSKGQVPETVDVTLFEVNNIADMLKSNLQTTSGDKVLQTGGMFFIDASANNRPLTIAPGKSIYVDLKTNRKYSGVSIFNGHFDNSGKINWINPAGMDSGLIPIPLNLLDFKSGGWECNVSKEEVNSLLKPELENTYIATREFEERMHLIQFTSCEQYKGLSKHILDIYTSHVHENLYYSDSLVATYIKNTYNDSIDTTRKFEFDYTGWVTAFYRTFTSYKEQRLTNPINFEKLGINDATTSSDLISKGYASKDADRIIAYFKSRNQIIKYRTTEKETQKLASYSFNINKLGWVNVDRFLSDPNTETSDFCVRIQSKDSLDYISVSLVIPTYSVSVFSIHQDGNQYSFTKKDDGYRKLPLDVDAFIVAFSYRENKPYFGKLKIKIPKTGIIDLKINETSLQEIKQQINKLAE